MTDPSTIHTTLLVLYSPRMESCRRFCSDLSLNLATEQHGQGPRHYAAVLADGAVFEIYPARPDRQTSALRLSFAVNGSTATSPLAPGRHLLTDPDGRAVEVHAT
jgi:hypothetical protein